MIANEIVHILAAPPDNLDTNLVKEAAGILKKDPYETRLLLSGKIPKIIAHYPGIEEAELIIKRLKTLGLVAVALRNSELAESPLTRFRAHALKLADREVTFFDKGGRQIKLDSKQVFIILKGKLQPSHETDMTVTRMKFNLTATLMTGIPVLRRAKETIKGTSNEEGYFVRIYDPISTEPKVEFFENYFDFSSLGSEIAPSTSVNLNNTITKLRTVFPQALFDDRLTQLSGSSSSSDKPARDIEMNCKYIYLYHQAVSRSSQP